MIGAVSAATTFAGMVVTPLAPQAGRTRLVAATLVVGGLAVTTFERLRVRWGPRSAGASAAAVTTLGWVVESVGTHVNGFAVGDRVSGEGHITCGHCRNCRGGRRNYCRNHLGLGVTRPGAFAEALRSAESSSANNFPIRGHGKMSPVQWDSPLTTGAKNWISGNGSPSRASTIAIHSRTSRRGMMSSSMFWAASPNI